MMAEDLKLAELVAALRAELEEAQAEGAGQGINFEVGPVELEVTVSVSKKGTGTGRVQFWVVTAEAGGELATAATQRIKLTLEPSTTQQSSATGSKGAELPRVPVRVAGDELENEQ